MSKEIQAIIFDMGGVILRTCDETPRKELAEELGVSLEWLKQEIFFSDSAIKSEEGLLDKYDLWRIILEKLGIPDADNPKKYDEKFWSGDYLDQTLIEYITELKKKYKAGLISNAFKGARDWLESNYQFLQVFDYSVFSYEVHSRKPDVKIYHHACYQLGVRPEQSVFVDDMQVNVEGARAAGLFAVHYQDTNRLKTELSKIINQIR